MNDDAIVDTLNELIEMSKDAEYGFRTSAQYLQAAETRTLFEGRADECQRAAAELQALVPQYGGKAHDSGSTGGAVHRGWVAVKATLAGYNDKSILEETEQGVDDALASYTKALALTLPPDLRAVVERQCEETQANHTLVRFLRDQARVASL